MKEFPHALMISYLEGRTSKQETKAIKAYIKRYPYYLDILYGLQDLRSSMCKGELEVHLQEQKSAARKQLFGTKKIPT